MKIHIAVGLFLISAFGLLFWRLNTTVGNNPFTKVAFAQAVCATNAQGDANCDGKIDASDYSVWRSQFKGEKIGGDADFNDDSKIDMKDFEIWRRGVLNSPSGAPTSTVPTITDTIDGCQCDLNVVTQNNCAAPAQPVCTGKFSCVCDSSTKPTSTPIPPPGCYYENVSCVQDPCPPILVCPSPTIAPTGTARNTPTPVPPKIPACSECGSNYGEKSEGLCENLKCETGQTCDVGSATCTINGVSNPNCFVAQCSVFNELQ